MTAAMAASPAMEQGAQDDEEQDRVRNADDGHHVGPAEQRKIAEGLTDDQETKDAETGNVESDEQRGETASSARAVRPRFGARS